MKKRFKDTKLGGFVAKASNLVPGVAGVALKVISGESDLFELGEALKESKDPNAKMLSEEFEKYKLEFKKDMMALEVEDRKDARTLYKNDSAIQKVFCIFFLICYAGLSFYLIYMLNNTKEVTELFKTMVTMIWTGTSMKVNTIVDFLFGGSMGK